MNKTQLRISIALLALIYTMLGVVIATLGYGVMGYLP